MTNREALQLAAELVVNASDNPVKEFQVYLNQAIEARERF